MNQTPPLRLLQQLNFLATRFSLDLIHSSELTFLEIPRPSGIEARSPEQGEVGLTKAPATFSVVEVPLTALPMVRVWRPLRRTIAFDDWGSCPSSPR